MEQVWFFCDGLRLTGDLRLPAGPGPHPAVVVCPGMSLTREVWVPAYAEGLTAAGFATLTLDWRGFGGSEGMPRNRLLPEMQVRDARAALDFLEARADIAGLGVLGVSLGCSVAVAVMAVDERVRIGVGVAGPADLGRVWGQFPGFPGFRDKALAARRTYSTTGEVRTVRVARLLAGDPATAEKIEADAPLHPTWVPEVTFESLVELFAFAPERLAGAIGPRPLVLVTPEEDPVIAGDELRSLAARVGPSAQLVVLAGARHVDVYGAGATRVLTEVLPHLHRVFAASAPPSPAPLTPDHEALQASWNVATRNHNAHKGDQAALLRSGHDVLFEEELELLGPLAGKRLVHLQCNAGQDSLGLARRGAVVTGVDLSDEAIAFARGLSESSGLAARFVHAELIGWLETTPERFDVAFTSYGATGWLPDLAAWARGVFRVLTPGGVLVNVEFHPTVWSVSEQAPFQLSGDDYFSKEAFRDPVGDYVAESGPGLGAIEVGDTVPNTIAAPSWQHGFAEVLTALLAAGFVLERVQEWPYANGCRLRRDLVAEPGRRWGWPAGTARLPLMYGIRARRP